MMLVFLWSQVFFMSKTENPEGFKDNILVLQMQEKGSPFHMV